MDFLKFLSGSKDVTPACDHTGQKLQRKLLPKSEFNVGMPGVGTAVSFKRNQPDYQYSCPVCRKDLPLGNNARWETLFNSYKPPIKTRPRPTTSGQSSTSSSQPNVKSSSSNQSGGGGYKREPIGSKLRYDILTRDKYRCVKCGAKPDDQTKLHVDHKLPVSKGGTNAPANLQTLCDRCNLGKGARIG